MFDNINIERVLVAPLDWGLGHATRCIPIIKALQELGKTVLLAGDGPAAQLLQTEFPSLTLLPLRGYH
ncbi:MAG: glycosyl transferase family 28, partial [Sediminibacterium sp.]